MVEWKVWYIFGQHCRVNGIIFFFTSLIKTFIKNNIKNKNHTINLNPNQRKFKTNYNLVNLLMDSAKNKLKKKKKKVELRMDRFLLGDCFNC